MEILNLILNCVVIVILIWVIFGLKKRLDTQKTMLDDHKEMLDSIMTYTKIIDIEKLTKDYKKWMEVKEESIQLETEKIIKKERELTILQLEKNMDTLKKAINELQNAARLAYNLIVYIPPHDRAAALSGVKEGFLKEALLKDIDNLPYARRNVLLEVLSTYTQPVSKAALTNSQYEVIKQEKKS